MNARSCNDAEHEARRAELRADAEHGTPCLVCGAPVTDGVGHDAGCMAEPALAHVPSYHSFDNLLSRGWEANR